MDNRPDMTQCQQCGGESCQIFTMPNIKFDTIKVGGFFSRQLGRWVESKSDVAKICRQQGHGCPELGIKVRQDENPPGPYRVSDTIVNRHVDEINDTEYEGHMPIHKQQSKREELKEVLSGTP